MFRAVVSNLRSGNPSKSALKRARKYLRAVKTKDLQRKKFAEEGLRVALLGRVPAPHSLVEVANLIEEFENVHI